MSGFKAVNIESDDESDVEIDDTKELQIEDALKLYQNALKYHAEGPESFDLAARAYEELFQSDIFKYPESQTELKRYELYGPLPETDELWPEEVQAGGVVATTGFDAGPSTLPQVLHLAHKNFAQFKLDYLTSRLNILSVTLNQILTDAATALDHFVEALDKDDGDLDLWRRTASVGDMLDSKRVARFCLEAVLDGDDEGLGGVLSLPGLEESLAWEQLHGVVAQLGDQLSFMQDSSSKEKRKVLSKLLKQRLGSNREIVARQMILKGQHDSPETYQSQRVTLKTPNTWAEVGEIILRQRMAEQHGTSSNDPGIAVAFDLSPGTHPKAKAIGAPPLKYAIEVDHGSSKELDMPITIPEGFPGLDDGRPTVQPQIASADPEMQTVTGKSTDSEVALNDAQTMILPTRKRSGDAAGLNDSPEEGRTKSKRTRTRDSTITDDNKQAMIDANTRWEYEQQINEIQAADDWMFETAGTLYERIGVVGFQAGRNVRHELQSPDSGLSGSLNGHDASHTGLNLARADLHTFLINYSDQLSHHLTAGGENFGTSRGPSVSSHGGSQSNGKNSTSVSKPALFPEDGLFDFLQEINERWFLTQEVAWQWIRKLLRPESSQANSYKEFLWPEDLKTMVVRTLVNFDDSICQEARDQLDHWKQDFEMTSDDGLSEMIETIFELHLDIYCLVKQPNSGVDGDTVDAQGDRLQRWSELAREALRTRSSTAQNADNTDDLSLRFLWATTFNIGAAADVTQDHVIECMNDLRAIFVAANDTIIMLQNNAVMPELSVAALDREISRLTTKDFFLKVTSDDQKDPVGIIENLEPLLESLTPSSPSQSGESEDANEQPLISVSPELVNFLQSSDISIRLMLWQRLRDAYLAIEYKPMVVSCHFKMIKLVLGEMKSTLSSMTTQADRQIAVLKTLRVINEIAKKALNLIQDSDNALECVDETSLKATIGGLGEVLQLIQVFNICEDSVRIGQTQPPTLSNGLTVASYSNVNSLIHEMQVHIWIILYRLLKEGIFQFHEQFPAPADDMFEFLRSIHRNLGLRGICGVSNRIFVRMLKDEFFQMTHMETYDSEQAQVLYDLYGLNCFLDAGHDLIEHHCTHDAFVDRSVALQAVDLLLMQASKLPMSALVKHPLKDTIDKVHGAAPRKRPTEAIMRNREIHRAFLRSPINPLDLYGCLKGEGNELTVSQVPKDDALLASKGWYFLMGHIALTKFRSVKRTAPTPTEDVDIAIAFFMQDLEYSADKWETWFRLAQAYDTKIEESVVWSAEKLNNSMNEIVQLQRAAIHCYTMATALAYRSADFEQETPEKMTELFTEFAMRLYASSRKPFSMLPFALEDTVKFFPSGQGHGVSEGEPFRPLRLYTTWKLTKVLLQKALVGKPESWTLHFALGKCLWKMHTASYDARSPHDTPPTAQQVLGSFVRAIELIPEKKDSREKREPILEPHYKLISVVHKLVVRGSITLQQAKEALVNTPYARTVTFPTEIDEWVPHILAVLKNLRAADKSNWHHRMVARAAQIVYDDDSDSQADSIGPNLNLAAISAKHELTQQMFTKTMVLQVWRPECERAGRHFVYTSRYTRFFVSILEQLKDRSNLEMLARRVRRRPHDLFEHGLVWAEICNAYLRLLRAHAGLPEGLETSTFSTIAHEDFLMRKEPLEKWMQSQDTGTSSALDVLREVQELKKINQSLMKPGPIDDLIGDSYAYLFNGIGKQLWDEELKTKLEEEAMRPPPTSSPPRHPTMSLTHLMNLDGATDVGSTVQPAPQDSAAQLASDQAPARRKIGVGRREIRTTAEACAQKANNTSTPSSKTSAPRQVQVVIESNRANLEGYASVETSAPGSIHDSADDESELSELEDEGADDEDVSSVKGDFPRPMFPGLASIATEGFAPANERQMFQHGDEDVDMDESEPKKIDGNVEGPATSNEVDNEGKTAT